MQEEMSRMTILRGAKQSTEIVKFIKGAVNPNPNHTVTHSQTQPRPLQEPSSSAKRAANPSSET